ncbi:MAG: phosphonate metabolism transcriptional regulator PhnF [Peptococcaceae bacterium]|jgi:GntR family transcriptional regulator|nr:phosphonate metabolism transcriptional regulator PhnF [Peptococcaceae bacterium]
MSIVDRQSPLPFYYQVYQYLRHNIEHKVYKEGEQLPSERDLSEQFAVNRFTIRKATEKLILDGLVYPIRRKGYFVKQNRVVIEIDSQTSYTRNASNNNLPRKVKILEMKPEYPVAELAEFFQLEKDQMVWSIYFLRYCNNVPTTLSRTYIPLKRAPELDKHLMKTRSLYKTLEENYGIKPRRINSICEIAFADHSEFRHLAVYKGFPLLQVTSLVVDQHGMPLEKCLTKFRSDMVKLNVKIADYQ